MTKNSVEEDPIDDSPTDELPVLTELDVVDDPESTSLIRSLDDTGQFDTVRVPSLESAQPDDTANLSLEVQLTELRALAADKDATIASLEERLEATRRAVARRDRVESALRAELDELNRLRESPNAELEQARGRRGELERRVEQQARQLEETRREIEQKAEAEQQLLDWLVNEEQQRAALSAELEQSRARAGRLEADLAAARDRTGALERELGERRADEAREAQEAGRHSDELERLRADLKRLGTELEAAKARSAELEREREAARKPAPRDAAPKPASGDARPPGAPAAEPPAAEDASLLRRSREEAAALAAYIENRRGHWNDMRARLADKDAELAELRHELEQRARRQRQAEKIASGEQRRTKGLRRELRELRFRAEARRRDEERSPPPRSAEDSSGVAQAQELEQLRREVETLRQAAADRDGELAHVTERHAELRRRFDAANAQLAEARAALAHFERLPERARAAVDRDAIDAWPSDGGEASGLRETLSLIPGRGGAPAAAAGERRTAPVLVCLTGDAPRSYPLAKETMTIGRAGHCEIQILTQFVSREHARLAVEPDGVQIEDLGSKNGVFVNSVRVERETLRNGDLVTVGETQFRFLAE